MVSAMPPQPPHSRCASNLLGCQGSSDVQSDLKDQVGSELEE